MKVLIIAAHPDDEVLGCGGTIYELVKKKHQVSVVFAADGVSGRPGFLSQEIKDRQKAATKVCRRLQITYLSHLSHLFPDQGLDREDFNKIVQWIENAIKETNPEIIYTHFTGDLNRDHRIVAEATIVACRPFSSNIKELYSYEIPETTENGQLVSANFFRPNVYAKINPEKKLKLFNQYETEKNRSAKWGKGIIALAQYRGFCANLEFAEAFLLLRKVDE